MMKLMNAGTTPSREYKPILRKRPRRHDDEALEAREVSMIICRRPPGSADTATPSSSPRNFDGTLLTFLFSAEDKINTTRLRLALRRHFSANRSAAIGPRDVAKRSAAWARAGSALLAPPDRLQSDLDQDGEAQGISLNNPRSQACAGGCAAA